MCVHDGHIYHICYKYAADEPTRVTPRTRTSVDSSSQSGNVSATRSPLWIHPSPECDVIPQSPGCNPRFLGCVRDSSTHRHLFGFALFAERTKPGDKGFDSKKGLENSRWVCCIHEQVWFSTPVKSTPVFRSYREIVSSVVHTWYASIERHATKCTNVGQGPPIFTVST